MSNAPDCNLDFYGDDFIKTPWPRYAEMRALGPVVWMTRLGNFALRGSMWCGQVCAMQKLFNAAKARRAMRLAVR